MAERKWVTLDWLKEHGACGEATKAFEGRFHKKAFVGKVVRSLTFGNCPDDHFNWLRWLFILWYRNGNNDLHSGCFTDDLGDACGGCKYLKRVGLSKYVDQPNKMHRALKRHFLELIRDKGLTDD